MGEVVTRHEVGARVMVDETNDPYDGHIGMVDERMSDTVHTRYRTSVQFGGKGRWYADENLVSLEDNDVKEGE